MRTSRLRAAFVAGAVALGYGGAAAPAWAAPPAQQRPATRAPDLEGTWTNVTMTRFERPAEFGNRLVMTPAEVAELEGERARVTELANRPTNPDATVEELPADCSGGRGNNCNYNAQWTEPGSKVMRVNGEPRTSIITFPANGRIPYTEEGRKRAARRDRGADNPEDRGLPERCLESQNIREGALMVSTLYNNNYEIVQSPEAVAIIVEMSHDARIIRLNAKHRTDGVREWFGDSIGWYEGDTLVVETTNFHPLQVSPATENLKVTEWFTRIAPDRLLYRFKVEDPATYTQPWGGEYEFRPSNGPLYEYACHEGNRGLNNILAGARWQEEQDRKAQAAGQPKAK